MTSLPIPTATQPSKSSSFKKKRRRRRRGGGEGGGGRRGEEEEGRRLELEGIPVENVKFENTLLPLGLEMLSSRSLL